MDSDNSKERELLEQMKQQQFLDHVKELQAKGQQVVLVVGERQEISKLVEKLGENTEVVSPYQLAEKVFDIKAPLEKPDIPSLPKKDREYWKPNYLRTFKKQDRR